MTLAIGIYKPTVPRTLGALRHTAGLFGVDFTFQVLGCEFDPPGPVPGSKARYMPHVRLLEVDEIWRRYPGVQIVALEKDHRARRLTTFSHPEDAIYLLGGDNSTLPPEALLLADTVVEVETPSRYPLDVATAGAIVLHDRHRYELLSHEAELIQPIGVTT